MWKVLEYCHTQYGSIRQAISHLPTFFIFCSVNIWLGHTHPLRGHWFISAALADLLPLSRASSSSPGLPDSSSSFSLTQHSLEGRESVVYIFISFHSFSFLFISFHSFFSTYLLNHTKAQRGVSPCASDQ